MPHHHPFTSTLYPTPLNRPTPNPLPLGRDTAYLINVEAETAQAVRRLGSHASLAVWGGNNEVEASFEW